MNDATIYIPAQDWDAVASLPQAWALPSAWQFAKRLALTNETTDARRGEPIEADVEFHACHITELGREVRVARVADGEGPATIVPSQVQEVAREDETLRSRLYFLADVAAQSSATYLVLYGNPEAPEAEYETDLVVSGEGFALEVENEHYRAVLSSLSGNWKSHHPKGWQAELDSGGGHGVEGTIHWGPDWSEERVSRYRLTSWDGPPMFDYEVMRGPVCVRVRRWGHPILSLGPQIGRPQKVMATVTYTFWAGQPYVIMESKLEVLEDVRFRDCRNDEFVIGEALPDRAWMDPDGQIGFGAKGWNRQDPRWMTYFNRDTGEGFGSVHLVFENTNPNWPEPDGAGFSRTGVWVRSPVHHANMQAGDHVYEKSACMQHHFEEGGPDSGFADLVNHQRRLLHPVTQTEAPPAPKVVSFDNVMDALKGTNEFELYVQGSPWGQRQLSFVDIGVVRNVVIDGQDIRVDVTMPYAGRETWLGWFSEEIEKQLRERLQDVGEVCVQLVREPKWTPQQMTDRARRTIGPST
jgi:metal-sulfur cluster biosynthetic enzyme